MRRTKNIARAILGRYQAVSLEIGQTIDDDANDATGGVTEQDTELRGVYR